ncbi:hypothetical protein BDZ91DRAFT_709891 [Kalaharituber pfeilii]|nr:hypothetical protein BDZ91DRAFT_709891 [Kalaharituber pfeilii]
MYVQTSSILLITPSQKSLPRMTGHRYGSVASSSHTSYPHMPFSADAPYNQPRVHGASSYVHRRAVSNTPPRPSSSPGASADRGRSQHGSGNNMARAYSLTSISSLPLQSHPQPTTNYRGFDTPQFANGNIHYRRHARNLALSAENLPGEHRSYSLTKYPDPPFYVLSQSPAMQKSLSLQGPAGGRGYQRAASLPQVSRESVTVYRGPHHQGSSIDFYAGVPTSSTGLPGSVTPRNHPFHGITMFEPTNGRSRAYSMTTMLSNETYNSSVGYSQKVYTPPHTMSSLNHSIIQQRVPHRKSHSNLYEDGHKSKYHSQRTSTQNSFGARPLSDPLPLQLTEQIPPKPKDNAQDGHPHIIAPYEFERKKRGSRRSSYCKIVGISSGEMVEAADERYAVANESARHSVYDWDLPIMRLSKFNLSHEGSEAQLARTNDGDGQEERRKLNETQYITTLDIADRPYTPDKFITTRLLGDKGNKATKSNAGRKSNSKWRIRSTKFNSPKLENNELDLELVPTLTNEEVVPETTKEGRKLQKARPKQLRQSLDLESPSEVGYGLREGISTGGRDGIGKAQDDAGDKEGSIMYGIEHLYTTTIKVTPTTGSLTTKDRQLAKNLSPSVTGSTEISILQTPSMKLLHRITAYIREKFSGVRKAMSASLENEKTSQDSISSNWRFRLIPTKLKDTVKISTTEVRSAESGTTSAQFIVPAPIKRLVAAATREANQGKQESAKNLWEIGEKKTDTKVFSGAGRYLAEAVHPIKKSNLASPMHSMANLNTVLGFDTKHGRKLWEAKAKEKKHVILELTKSEANPDLVRIRTSNTAASSFKLKRVTARIGADSPSGFEVVGGKGAGRSWGLETEDLERGNGNKWGGRARREVEEGDNALFLAEEHMKGQNNYSFDEEEQA